MRVKDAGAWRNISDLQIKDAGAWRKADSLYVKKDGVWTLGWTGFTADIPAGTYTESEFLTLVNTFVSAGVTRTYVSAVSATIAGSSITNWTAIRRYNANSGTAGYVSSHSNTWRKSSTNYTTSIAVFPQNTLYGPLNATIILNEDIVFV